MKTPLSLFSASARINNWLPYMRKLLREIRVALWTRKMANRANVAGHIRINGPGKVIAPHNLFIGDNSHFAGDFFIHALGGVYIGENCHISRNVTVYSCNHDYEGTAIPYDANYVLKPVYIEDNVWIGMNVSIIPGLTIGHGAVVGMGSVVTKDVPPLAVVGGNPATTLKFRDVSHYEELVSRGCFGGSSGSIVIKIKD